MIRGVMATDKEAQETSARPRMYFTIIMAIVLFLLDAFVMQTFYIAGILFLFLVPIKLVKASKLRKEKTLFKQALIGANIYAMAAICIFIMFTLNNMIAVKRAERIAGACEQYRAKFGDYPSSLSLLVPEFMKEIPSPKIGLASGGFRYITTGGSHRILFVKLPPYGRKYYGLETKKWGDVD
jgi:hypothetical protein